VPDRVIRVFSETLCIPPEQLSDTTSPEETPQWDSVAAMKLALAIEDEFDLRLSTREIMAMRSIGIVKKVLRNKGVTDV
jgi:acyl carrier protein